MKSAGIVSLVGILVLTASLSCFGQPREDYLMRGKYRNDFSFPEDAFQLVLDVEDPCFEFLSGEWQLAKTGDYHGYYYFTIDGPGSGDAQGRWIAEGLPQGTYQVEYYRQNGDFPKDARYQVTCSDGVHETITDMNFQEPGWTNLGEFPVNRVCVVTISDYWLTSGTRMSADALRFTLKNEIPPPPETTVPPHIGLCIDDAGGVDPTLSGKPIYRMLRLPFKMTFAVMPNRPYTDETAVEVFKKGSEVILHQPMGYISNPNPGAGWINDDMTLDQVRDEVSKNLDALPHIIGMNNHTGSLVTQQTDKMQVCMEELKKRGLFFYDSRTYTYSVAYDVAKQNGLLAGERDLFIDGSNQAESMNLVRSLAMRALHAPYVPHLAIGHVRSHTAAALEAVAPELQAMGVEVWPISRCMAQLVEADFQPRDCGFCCEGSWISSENDRYSKQLHDGFCRDSTDGATTCSIARFTPSLPEEGDYDVYTTWFSEDGITTGCKIKIYDARGKVEIDLDQTKPIQDWKYLGRFTFLRGTSGCVEFISNSKENDSFMRADAVKFVYAGEAIPPPHTFLLY